MLTDRLNRLVEEGILTRVRYSEKPERFEYRLTGKGKDLLVPLTALRQWGDEHISTKPPRVLRRKGDDQVVVAPSCPRARSRWGPARSCWSPAPSASRPDRRLFQPSVQPEWVALRNLMCDNRPLTKLCETTY